jgi:hypothetical protein
MITPPESPNSKGLDGINFVRNRLTAILRLSFALNILALAQVFGIAYFIPKTKKVT